jgi:cation diffusion facilitator family transporter
VSDSARRDLLVRRILLLEGLANFVVLLAKLTVGLMTGSLAVLGDAVHSLTDVANNVVAWVVIKLSGQPPDREHPYGHRKFETLAVFGLATLLTVLAVELGLHAIQRKPEAPQRDAWTLGLMLGVLCVNVTVATWQRYWARRLESDILLADANHTFADVLTTIVVIGGWQLSAMGYPWLDSACALGVSGLVLYLAYGLFRRAFPVLVDRFAVAPEDLAETAMRVPGVRGVRRVRSRSLGKTLTVDMVITVDPQLSTSEAHRIADAVERLLGERHQVGDTSIHIEPDR